MTDEQAIRIVYEDMYRAMIGRSRVNAAVYGGGRHTWRLKMDSQLRKIDGQWKITLSKASTY